MSELSGVDTFGRTPIADAVKRSIDDAFTAVPDGNRAALLVIADESGARVHVAAKLSDGWKVAAGAGRTWSGDVTGTVSVVGVW